MKMLLVVLFLLPTVLFAESGNLTDEQIRAKATESMRQIAGPLQLNEQEYIKVRELTIQKLTALNDISDYYKYDKVLLEKHSTKAIVNYENRLKYLLSAHQIENYLTLKSQQINAMNLSGI